MKLNWLDFVTVCSATLIPALTTSIVAIIKAVKADGKAKAVAQDVNTIAHLSPQINGQQLNSQTIAPEQENNVRKG